MSVTDPQPTDPRAGSRWLLDVPETLRELHISRTVLFRLFASQEIHSVKIGRKRLVPISSLEAYIAKLQEVGEAGKVGRP